MIADAVFAITARAFHDELHRRVQVEGMIEQLTTTGESIFGTDAAEYMIDLWEPTFVDDICVPTTGRSPEECWDRVCSSTRSPRR